VVGFHGLRISAVLQLRKLSEGRADRSTGAMELPRLPKARPGRQSPGPSAQARLYLLGRSCCAADERRRRGPYRRSNVDLTRLLEEPVTLFGPFGSCFPVLGQRAFAAVEKV